MDWTIKVALALHDVMVGDLKIASLPMMSKFVDNRREAIRTDVVLQKKIRAAVEKVLAEEGMTKKPKGVK